VKAVSSRKNILEKEMKEIKNETERNKAVILFLRPILDKS